MTDAPTESSFEHVVAILYLTALAICHTTKGVLWFVQKMFSNTTTTFTLSVISHLKLSML